MLGQNGYPEGRLTAVQPLSVRSVISGFLFSFVYVLQYSILFSTHGVIVSLLYLNDI